MASRVFRVFRGFIQFRFLQKAELHLSAFEFDYRAAEGAEGGLYVAHEFVDASGVLPAGHAGIAAGDAFDEIDKCLFNLANIADCCDKPENGKKKIVELGMVRHDCGDRFGKCDSNLSFELDMV